MPLGKFYVNSGNLNTTIHNGRILRQTLHIAQQGQIQGNWLDIKTTLYTEVSHATKVISVCTHQNHTYWFPSS